jgi:hypothetical protein
MSFATDLDKAVLNIKGFTEKQVRGTLFGLSSRIIKESPVDTGRFRGNWQASIGSPVLSTTSRLDSTGAGSINDAAVTVQGLKLGQTFYLTNNLPYARRLEYGYSKQAPSGFLRINLQRVQLEINKARQ